MTEAISADLAKALASAKPVAVAAPPTSAAPTAPKPADKPSAKPADIKPPVVEKSTNTPPPSPAPGAKTFLGWIAASVSKKQLMVAAAAVGSLVAGIAVVKFLVPEDDLKPTASATQPLVPDAWPETKPIVPHTGPALTVEPPKQSDFIPPAGLAMPPVLPMSGGTIPPPPSGVILPPPPGSSGVASASSGPAPAAPLSPTRERTALPAPDPFDIPVVPASGTTPTATGGTLPLIPPVAGAAVPPAPPTAPSSIPALPGTPIVPPAPMGYRPTPPTIPEPGDLTASGPKPPPAAVTGRPVIEPPMSLVPPIGTLPAVPPVPMDLKPAPPATPGGNPPKIEFIKPAESGTVMPVAGSVPAPMTSFDVDIYHPKANDSWEAISREYYNDTKFAAALRAYNQNRALTSATVDVPPIHVLRRTAPPAAVPGVPTSARPVGGDPWNAAGGSGNGAKTWRVPNGDGLSLPAVAKLTLGNDQRWRELYDLNPDVNPSKVPGGTELKLPADARVQ